MELEITNYQNILYKVIVEYDEKTKKLNCKAYRALGIGGDPRDCGEMKYEQEPSGVFTICGTIDHDDEKEIETSLTEMFNDRSRFTEEINPVKRGFYDKDLANRKTFPYYKISMRALARIVMAIDGDLSWDGEGRFKFSIAPDDTGLNYYVGQARLYGQQYTVIYAPSVAAKALLFDEMAYSEEEHAKEILEFLQSQKHEEDMPDKDGMVYVERNELIRICQFYRDMDFSEDDIKIPD